jgi:hypothetical protein
MTQHVLYQTWKTSQPPPDMQAYRDMWLQMTPGWEHPLLTDDDLRGLVSSNFPEYLHAYDSFTNHIERVDFARYIMMWLGGVYADLDTYPIKSINVWVDKGKIIIGQEPSEHAGPLYGRDIVLCNAFLISPPKQKFWVKLMDYIIENYEPYYDPVSNTGPIALTKFYESSKDLFKDVIITPSCTFFPMIAKKDDGTNVISKDCNGLRDSFVAHVWKNSWTKSWHQDQRWRNRRYWFYGLMILFAIIWVVCFYKYYV